MIRPKLELLHLLSSSALRPRLEPKAVMPAPITQAILLVEDSAADAYLIQRAVKGCGPDLQLWIMPDGVAALAFLRKALPVPHLPTPTLILLDLRLPTMSGIQLLFEIRHLPAYEQTPIVILSRLDKEREEVLCLHL
jgi:two-component system, chemotaxis family, response regulator Rcp1